MKESASFSGMEVENTSMNFTELREKGIEFSQNFSGEVWTDYNSHDPGITILEQLCFALTDIAFRTSLPIEDLLTPEKGIPIDPAVNAFYTPSRILSSHAVTTNDQRKMIIAKFEEIQNAWLIPSQNSGYEEQINGVNQIEILPTLKFLDSINSDPQLEGKFLNAVKKFLNENRNIGEIYEKAYLLQPQPINIEFEIYIDEQTELERTIAELFLTLLNFVYSRIHYHSYDEMQEAGYSLEETFSGPRLKNGFIKDKNLKDRIKTIHINELQKLFSKVNSIAKCVVKSINYNGIAHTELVADKEKFFHLLIRDTTNDMFDNRFDTIYKHMTVFLNQKKLAVLNKSRINSLFAESWSKSHRGYRIGKSLAELFHNKLKGTYRNPDQYFSLQRHFPLIYGIGEVGLSQNEPTERHSKALQLKAYLMLFEQHLANHLSQLGNLNEFFNIDIKKSQEKTYFAQWMTSIPNIEKLVSEKLATEQIKAIEKYLEPENTYFDRKNRIYNHLLARFGEDLNEIPWKVALRLNMIKNEDEFNRILLRKKSEFLMNLKKLSYNRAKGESFYPEKTTNSNHKSFRNPSGLEQIILAKTGIPERGNRSLIPEFAELKNHGHKIKEDPLNNKEDLNRKFRPLISNEINNFHQSGHPMEIPNAMFGSIGLKALFKETLNYNNYRLSKEKSASGKIQVIFQKEKNRWANLLECSDEKEAVQCIHQLISHFTQQNNQSEGIYFVDHILLNDLLLDSTCGFSFYDEYGTLLFHTGEKELWWNSVEYRNERLEKFYKFGKIKAAYTYSNGEWMINDDKGNILATYFTDTQNPISRKDLLKQTISIIQLFDCSENADGRLRFDEMEKIRKKGSFHDKTEVFGQRRLVFQRRLSNGDIIDEDFFNLNISVLMPDWPARFQVERYKDYVADLIQERIPAHIGNDILWVNMHEMKLFEEKYHAWEKLKSEPGNSKTHSQKIKSAAYKVYQAIMTLKKNK